jgi:hypothetical protein
VLAAASRATEAASQRPPLPLKRQVFISHTASDEGARVFAASVLKVALDTAGIKNFIDYKMDPGCNWPAKLEEEAATSAVFVVVLSKNYPQRFWCLHELDVALNGHRNYPRQSTPFIIPVYYDAPKDVSPPSPEQLQQLVADHRDGYQHQQFQEDRAEHWPGNMQHIIGRHQSVRRAHQDDSKQEPRSSVPLPKDEEWQMALRVVAEANQHLPKVALAPEVLFGFEEQAPDLAAQLFKEGPGQVGLWLYGPGADGENESRE